MSYVVQVDLNDHDGFDRQLIVGPFSLRRTADAAVKSLERTIEKLGPRDGLTASAWVRPFYTVPGARKEIVEFLKTDELLEGELPEGWQ